MATFQVVINGSKLAEVERRAGEVDLRRRGNRVLNAARRNVDVDTGRLRASLHMEIIQTPKGPVARIGSNLGYAMVRERGSGIYAGKGPIRPRNASVLRWPATNNSGQGNRRYSGGKTSGYIFAREVKGQKGSRFLERSLEAARG